MRRWQRPTGRSGSTRPDCRPATTSLARTCAPRWFKGEASYWAVQVGGDVHEDLVWSYQTPIPEAAAIAGLLCFYNERVDLTVSGASSPDAEVAATS